MAPVSMQYIFNGSWQSFPEFVNNEMMKINQFIIEYLGLQRDVVVNGHSTSLCGNLNSELYP